MNVTYTGATEKGTHKQQLHNNIWFFTKWHYVLPEDGTYITKDVGEAHLMFVLIKNVYLVGK